MPEVLTVDRLVKKYPKFELHEVSFGLEEGSVMGFIGRNGAGKTTTLKSLLGFVHPDSGEVRFFGRNFSEDEMAIKQRIGFVSGGVNYYMNKKLRTIIEVNKLFYNEWDDTACRKYLDAFRLDPDKTLKQLSEGMKVKFALLLALSHNAKILLLDEPTSGLDPVSRDDLLDVFLDLAHDHGISILFSTHITTDLEKCADYITYIKDGGIVASGKISAFIDSYRLFRAAPGQMTPALEKAAVGIKRLRDGASVLLRTPDAYLGAGLSPATVNLEEIMVHIEKEARI